MAGSTESLNDIPVSWAEIQATLSIEGGASLPDLDWKNIDHEDKVERGLLRGQGGIVKAKSTGMRTSTASGSLARGSHERLLEALANLVPQNAAGEYQVSKARFTLIIKHSYEADSRIFCVELHNCSLDKDGFKHAEGSEVDYVDIDLSPTKIVKVLPSGKRVVLL